MFKRHVFLFFVFDDAICSYSIELRLISFWRLSAANTNVFLYCMNNPVDFACLFLQAYQSSHGRMRWAMIIVQFSLHAMICSFTMWYIAYLTLSKRTLAGSWGYEARMLTVIDNSGRVVQKIHQTSGFAPGHCVLFNTTKFWAEVFLQGQLLYLTTSRFGTFHSLELQQFINQFGLCNRQGPVRLQSRIASRLWIWLTTLLYAERVEQFCDLCNRWQFKFWRHKTVIGIAGNEVYK